MQAARCPGRISRRSGTPWLHCAMAMGQRGWKTQPGGGLSGLGTSPPRIVRSRVSSTAGSGMGTAESSALVYGCSGFSYSDCRSVISTILPRYITATRSEMWRATEGAGGDEEGGQAEAALELFE